MLELSTGILVPRFVMLRRVAFACHLFAFLIASTISADPTNVREFVLDNGLKVLLDDFSCRRRSAPLSGAA